MLKSSPLAAASGRLSSLYSGPTTYKSTLDSGPVHSRSLTFGRSDAGTDFGPIGSAYSSGPISTVVGSRRNSFQAPKTAYSSTVYPANAYPPRSVYAGQSTSAGNHLVGSHLVRGASYTGRATSPLATYGQTGHNSSTYYPTAYNANATTYGAPVRQNTPMTYSHRASFGQGGSYARGRSYLSGTSVGPSFNGPVVGGGTRLTSGPTDYRMVSGATGSIVSGPSVTHGPTLSSSQVGGRMVSGSVLGEHVNEHRIRIPKRIIRENVYEDREFVEDVVEDEVVVNERVIEVMKPVIEEEVIEIPEVVYEERLVEVPQRVTKEIIKKVPSKFVHTVENYKHVPKIYEVPKVMEVPQVQYRQVPVIKQVPVPQVVPEYHVKENPVPQYVEKPIEDIVDVKKPFDVPVYVPVPIQADITTEYEVPRIRPQYENLTYPIYLPKFVEVPLHRSMVDQFLQQQVEKIQHHTHLLTAGANGDNTGGVRTPFTLETLNNISKNLQVQHQLSTDPNNVVRNFLDGHINIMPSSGYAGRGAHPGVYSASGRSGRRSRKSRRREEDWLKKMGCPSSLKGFLLDRLGHTEEPDQDVYSTDIRPVNFREQGFPCVDLPDDDHSYCSSCSQCNANLVHMQEVRSRSRV